MLYIPLMKTTTRKQLQAKSNKMLDAARELRAIAATLEGEDKGRLERAAELLQSKAVVDYVAG